MKITYRKITASTNNFDVFMLMDYWPGYEGMESDDFYCYGKFYAKNIEDANQQFEACKRKYTNIDTDSMYVSEYNEYFDDFDPDGPGFDPFNYRRNEVFSDLDTLFGDLFRSDDEVDEELPFTSTDVDDLDEVYGDTEDVATDFDIRWDEKFGEPTTEYDINNINASTDFFDWYDSLDDEAQERVDDISDRNAIPLYTEASEEELNWIKHLYESEHDHIEPIESASYGGAYDIEDDMFFNKDEIVEWADRVIDEFNIANNENFKVEDVYFANTTDLVLDAGNGDTSFVANVKIDMRRIHKPSDIDKYVGDAVAQLQAAYDNFNSYNIQSSTEITAEDDIEDSNDEEGFSNIVDEDKPERIGEIEGIQFPLDVVVIVDDDGKVEYEDQDYRWTDDIDVNPNNEPIELDDTDGIVEKVMELIESSIPVDSGRYNVTGDVYLTYEVTGIESEIVDAWDEGERGMEYDIETYATNDAKAEYIYRESGVDDLKVEKL